MPSKESFYPDDWLRIADRDLARVQLLLDSDDPEAAGFYLQQALEKYLKAFLLARGWSLRRTHDLEALLNDALEYQTSLEPFRPLCQKATGFYFFERYPFATAAGLTLEDVTSSLREAKKMIAQLKQKA